MCGIAGVAYPDRRLVDVAMLGRMAAVLRHRGPDGYGFYAADGVGFGHVRLSIIDLTTGAQPLGNGSGAIWVTYNGEIYNYVELTAELEARGHHFRTHSDTEVLVHGYQQWGEGLLERLNGQFAFALHDRAHGRVLIARDRFGVRPLFYALDRGVLTFASEIKGILAAGHVRTEPDLEGLDEIFTFWATLPPRTPFAGIHALEPGTFAVWQQGSVRHRRYYALGYPERSSEPEGALAELDGLLRSSVRFRMRADVTVGGYLSGGLDSSITSALALSTSPRLNTFSITFEDPALDESAFQRIMARALGTNHLVQPIAGRDVAEAFPGVVWHTETPLVRTAPAPMYLLSRLTRDHGIKVVLTGEGADELFLGYDLFKETLVRRFCLRQPTSTARPRLFDRLYPYLTGESRGGEFWRRFFLDAGGPDDPLFSHLPRFLLTSRIKEFFSPEAKLALGATSPLQALRDSLPPEFAGWSALGKAAYLEMRTLLSPYLLSSQGDRMGMAHSVEGRFPFLDHRLYEFAAALPARSKLRGLREKDILRRWAAPVLPPAIGDRGKQPYRAPDVPSFFGEHAPAYVADALSPETLRATGLFEPRAVAGLMRRCQSGRATGFRENQAFVAILSTQLWHERFFAAGGKTAPLPLEQADVLALEATPVGGAEVIA